MKESQGPFMFLRYKGRKADTSCDVDQGPVCGTERHFGGRALRSALAVDDNGSNRSYSRTEVQSPYRGDVR